MKICSKCKNIMKPLDKGMFECISCNHKGKGKDLIETEKIPEHKIVEEGVVEDKNIFADYPFTCEKCGLIRQKLLRDNPMFLMKIV